MLEAKTKVVRRPQMVSTLSQQLSQYYYYEELGSRNQIARLFPWNIFYNKSNVESMLNGRLNHVKFDWTRFQQAFNIFYPFNNVERPV